MDTISYFIDLILHIDKYLNVVILQYGTLTYAILFFIIFAETGFVLTPFLPGDSLLFAIGAFAAAGSFDLWVIYLLLVAAAILGDNVNYWAGNFVGPKVFHKEKVRFLKKEYLEKTHQFYEKHGGKTIIIAKFIPIIRTFAPFVAGVGKMTYGHFLKFNITGGLLWVSIFIFGGYFFGNLPFVKNNFSIVIIAIIFISVLPGIIQVIKARSMNQTEVIK